MRQSPVKAYYTQQKKESISTKRSNDRTTAAKEICMTTKNTSRNDEKIGPEAANAADRRHNGVDERRP